MPELPEVETIKRGLQSYILNKEINNLQVHHPRAFENPQNLDIYGQITHITRHGKYLLLKIKNKCTLLIHLRMTGKLIYCKDSSDMLAHQKHIRVIFGFVDGDSLIFNDIRTFGKVEVIPVCDDLQKIKNIGVDALSKDFNLGYFTNICHKKKVPIKNLLLDQSLIAGIGNIYAMEILFKAHVSPLRLANTFTPHELSLIHKYTLSILQDAILHNGTTISDFKRIDDKSGEFQNFLQVYGKEVCPVCGAELCKIKQGGRGTRYCEVCQV